MWGKEYTEDEIKEARKYLNELLGNSEIVREICSVEKGDKSEDVSNSINKYKPFKYNVSTEQSGRVWILVGTENGKSTALTVGQSLDIFGEINDIIKYKILGDDYNDGERSYSKMADDYKILTFYEVEIDKYLEMTFGKLCKADGIVKVMFDMSKEYMAEAALAYHTYALHWRFYNSGMDKRALYHLITSENNSCDE